MKVFLLAAAVLMSVTAMAYETESDTSYSGPSDGVSSGSTQLSGTSGVAARKIVRRHSLQQAMAALQDESFQLSNDVQAVVSYKMSTGLTKEQALTEIVEESVR